MLMSSYGTATGFGPGNVPMGAHKDAVSGRVGGEKFSLERGFLPWAPLQASSTASPREFGGKMFPFLALVTTHLCALDLVSYSPSKPKILCSPG